MTLKDRCKSEESRKRLEIEDVADVVRERRLRWFGRLERKDARDWVIKWVCKNMATEEMLVFNTVTEFSQHFKTTANGLHPVNM